VAGYDASRPLVIDPVLSYSTYLGGSDDDSGNGIAVDADGNAYVVGDTMSVDFPTANPLQPGFGGSNQNAFVAKLSADGSALVYATYLGGSGREEGHGIAADAEGNAYVAGETASADFPTAKPLQPALMGRSNAFVAKLSADGSALVYATYLGGSGTDEGDGIAVDADGNAYVAGMTSSLNFPTTPAAFQTLHGSGPRNGFVTKLTADGSALVYATYLGGSGRDEADAIAVDADGNAYVAGETSSLDFPTTPGAFQTTYSGGMSKAFVTKLNADGSGLIYSTYLGGSGEEEINGPGLAVDAAGNAYLTGITNSTDFPTANALQRAYGGGASDAFVAKLNADGSELIYSTYFGGSGTDEGVAIAVDASGNAYLTGNTTSLDFPTANPLQPANAGLTNAFVAKLTADGSALVYSTYLGGSYFDEGHGLAVDGDGNAYVTGKTSSPDFPTANPLQRTNAGCYDAFVAKITNQ
jgi:hypothetical protein